MNSLASQAELLRSLHVPGDPLVVFNVWDAVSARVVAATPGVKALATASHSISDAHGVSDGGGLGLDGAVEAARVVIDAVDLPVSVDFEKGYGGDAAGVERSVTRLIDVGAAGLNIEDSIHAARDGLFDIRTASERVAAARSAGDKAHVPIVINARVDTLIGGGDWPEARERSNAYLAAGADVIFMFGLDTEDKVKRAVDEIAGPLSVIAGATSIPLKRLAELGVCRVSFGGRPLALAMAHLRVAAAQLTALGDYPSELSFDYS
ncbi:MAG: isocitrate lyase/phosphoenolpyruvate mutase family protein [Terrimesophilobacter sp.]